jgi:diadenosine tetraphosphate (Ap4A) HIT family hydrolase
MLWGSKSLSHLKSTELLVFEDETFSLEQNAACPIPGYLILRLKGAETSLAQLPPETVKLLGSMLGRAAAAIEKAVESERVYILSFCEVEPRLHFHLFPRTAWLLKEYLEANDCASDAFRMDEERFRSGQPFAARNYRYQSRLRNYA